LRKIDVEDKKGEPLEKIYRSKSGKKYGDFIFFNANEFLEYKRKLDDASLSEICKILEEVPLDFLDFDMDTCDTMRDIFETWDSFGKKGDFTREEMNEFSKNLERLIPWTDDLEKIIGIIKRINRNDEKTDLESKELKKAIEKAYDDLIIRKGRVRKGVESLYESNRMSGFYSKRIFIKKQYATNGQWELLLEWKRKWMFVIDNIEALYSEKNKDMEKLRIQDIVSVFLIWYQYPYKKEPKDEERRKGTTEKEETNKKPGSTTRREFMNGCQNVLDDIENDLRKLAPKDRDYLLKECRNDLLNIKEAVERNIESIQQRQEMGQVLERKTMFSSVRECIKIINPCIDDRIDLMELANKEIAEEESNR
jgi:hypothetical protein